MDTSHLCVPLLDGLGGVRGQGSETFWKHPNTTGHQTPWTTAPYLLYFVLLNLLLLVTFLGVSLEFFGGELQVEEMFWVAGEGTNLRMDEHHSGL